MSMGASGLSSSICCDPHDNPPESHPDTTMRLTRVYVLGTWGSRLCPVQPHWAAAFDFQGGFVLIVELTAIDSRGRAWQENKYNITEVPDLDAFERKNSYRKLRHQQIWITTSPHELHQKCAAHPMNKQRYGLFFNNCQKYIAVLLRDQYHIDETNLPGRCGWGCYVFFRCLLILGVSILLYYFFVYLSFDLSLTCCESIFDSPVSGPVAMVGHSVACIAFFFCICFCACKRCNPSAAATRAGQ